jgi:tetratricopeptide (TPR) repeat protein
MRNRVAGVAAVLGLALTALPACRATTCSAPRDVSAAALPHPDAAAYANEGNWYAQNQQFDCAVDAFRSAQKLDPTSAHIDYLLGLSLYLAGHSAEAAEPLQHAVRADPSILRPHVILASVLMKLGQYRPAAEQWQAALKLDPHSTMAQDGLCKALLALGQSEAVVGLLSGKSLDEDQIVDLVQALEMENHIDEAADVLTRAMKTYPSSDALAYAMVTVLVKQHHPERAGSFAETFAHVHPRDFSAQKIYLGTIEFNSDPAMARPVAQQLLAQAPHDPEVLYLAGIDDCILGDYEHARSRLQEAIARDPDRYSENYNARYYLGTALFQMNDFRGAKEELEKALGSRSPDPQDRKPQARFELAIALRNLGEKDEARQQMTLFQQEKDEADNRVEAAHKAITAADEMERGAPDKAAQRYREALAASPNDANLQYKLALALDSTHDLTGERTELEQAVQIDPTFALAQYQLGYVKSQEGDLAGAEEQFRLAVKAAPGYTKAWISLAATLAMESKLAEAQAAVSRALHLAPKDPDVLELERELSGNATPVNR